MIERCVNFTKNELFFIDTIDLYFNVFAQGNVNGTVFYREDFVRYELNIGNEDDKFILQFCVRDNEKIEARNTNFVYISNILVPMTLSRQGIAKGIITLMSQIANEKLDIPFYITGIVNDEWKNSLINHGGEEDEDGDVKIIYNKWKVLNAKYGIAYLNKKGDAYTETEPYIYNCCCIEELKIAMILGKQEGYQTLIPFFYKDKHDCDSALSWEYCEKNRIVI